MSYGLFRKGKGGQIRKIKSRRGKPKLKNMVVWATTKKQVLTWIKKWGTKSQKEKHLKCPCRGKK